MHRQRRGGMALVSTLVSAMVSAIWLAAVCVGSALAAQAGAQELPGADVESLLAWARSANAELASERYAADAAAARADAADAWPDPRVRIEWMDTTKTTWMQELPWWGKRDLRREVADGEARGAALAVDVRWTVLVAQIKTAFAQYYIQTADLGELNTLITLTERLEAQAQSRYAAGLVSQAEVLRLQLERTQLHNERQSLIGEQAQVRARLNGLLGRPAAAPLAAPQRWTPLPPPSALGAAALDAQLRERNPALAAEAARIEAAQANQALVLRNRYPDPTLGIIANRPRDITRRWDVMLEFSIPLQQGARRAQAREADAQLASAQAKREAVWQQLQAELGEAREALEAAMNNAHRLERQAIPQAELTARAALDAYQSGTLDLATTLDAQRQLRLMRRAAWQAQAQARMALAQIERVTGEVR